jgi:hypothetical protein
MSANRPEAQTTCNSRLSQKWLQAVGALLQSGVLQGPGRRVPSRELEPSPMYWFALMVAAMEMYSGMCKAENSEFRSQDVLRWGEMRG